METRSVETAVGPIEVTVAGDGPPVLSLHGSPGGAGQGMAFASHFRDGGLKVIAPSRPGYGETPLERRSTFADHADLAAALLEALNVERAAIFAVSGGGPTALQIALRHPDRVDALILEDAVTENFKPSLTERAGDELMFSHPALELFARQVEKDTTGAIAGMLKSVSTLDHEQIGKVASAVAARPGMKEWLAELVPNLAAKRHHAGYRHDLHLFTELPEYPLDQIRAPALICHGEADSEVPLGHAQHATDAIPGAELLAVAEAGHILTLSERGQEVRERQLAFAKQHSG